MGKRREKKSVPLRTRRSAQPVGNVADLAERPFELVSEFTPTGDQPRAIETLSRLLEEGALHSTLLGVTGSGKTFTVAKIVAHRDQPVPSLRAIRGDVPKPLEVAFQKMVAKNPKLRHQTMTRVIAALQNFGSGGAPTGGKPVAPSQAARSQAATGTVNTPRSTIATSPVPPAPTEALPPAKRRKDALRQAKEMQRRH